MENKEDLFLNLKKNIKLKESFLGLSDIKKVIFDYGQKVKRYDTSVILGRDTRPSGEILEKVVIDGLTSAGCTIINLGVCPTPVICFFRKKLNITGSVIISASEKTIEYNKIKLCFNDDIIFKFLVKINSNNLNHSDSQYYNSVKNLNPPNERSINPFLDYSNALTRIIDISQFEKLNKLRVVIDPGAGAGKIYTPKILEKLGCEVLVINNDLNKQGNFPRELRPVKENLNDIILTLWKGNYDIGFVHDCDADKLTIVSDNFDCYSEDIGAAIILDYFLNHPDTNHKKFIFCLNMASSLRFEVLAEHHNVQIFRNYIANSYIQEYMKELMNNPKDYFIFGSLGLHKGHTFPYFNNTRDGIFIAAKLVEILVKTDEKISILYSKLPRYYDYNQKINVSTSNMELFIKKLYQELTEEGEFVTRVEMNLRFGQEKEWFVLITPSYKSIRVVSEAKSDTLARLYCETTIELIKMLLSEL